MGFYAHPASNRSNGYHTYNSVDDYDDYNNYIDCLDFDSYNNNPQSSNVLNSSQQTLLHDTFDAHNTQNIQPQYAVYPSNPLPTSLSSPAAINNYLEHNGDTENPSFDSFHIPSTSNNYSNQSISHPVYSRSTGNLDLSVPELHPPPPPSFPGVETPLRHSSISPVNDSLIPSSPERPAIHPLGPRDPPSSFSRSPRRRDNHSPSSRIPGQLTYHDSNRGLPLSVLPDLAFEKDDSYGVADSCNFSDVSSLSAVSERSSSTSTEHDKFSSRLPSTPSATSPTKPSLDEITQLQNYARKHSASGSHSNPSLNIHPQDPFGGKLPSLSTPSNAPVFPPRLDTPIQDLSITSSVDTLIPLSKRTQRSQTFTKSSDDLLIPPPARSYSTVSKSFAGSSSNDGSFRTVSINSSSMGDDEDASLMLRLDLPSIPDTRSQLDPAKLSSRDFELCNEPWMLSSICKWIIGLNSKEMTSDTLSEALIGLFRHTIPTLSWVSAERITVPLLESLVSCGFLTINKDTGVVIVHDENSTTGVLTSIAGKGCYSPKNHKDVNVLAAPSSSSTLNHKNESGPPASYHCYSSRCYRNIPFKPVLPGLKQALKVNDNDRVNWAKIWGLTDEDLKKLDKKLIERQCAIQEFIGTEEMYVRGLKAFLNVYGDHLSKTKPHVVPNQAKFWSNTFSCISGLIESNDNQLLSHLKVRQAQQGPYISKIADIVLNWLKSARQPYLARAATYSHAMRVVTSEKGKNSPFTAWLNRTERDPRLTRQQKFDFLIASPFTRLCRYNLLFDRIRTATPPTSAEYHLWRKCIDECKSLVTEYNRIYGEAEDVSSIMTLEERIVFSTPEEKVDLRLWEPRRKIYYEGDVVRKGEYGLDYVDTHMILLDHYLILAKVKKNNLEKYIVSKRPIALDLLVVEQADGEPVSKSNAKMLTGVLSGNSDTRRLSKIYNTTLPNSLRSNNSQNNNGSNSTPGSRLNSIVGLTNLNTKDMGGSSVSNLSSPVSAGGGVNSHLNSAAFVNTNDSNENIVYPIKIHDLGSETARKSYYIYTQTEEERKTWVNKILLAKRDYSSTAFALNSEPFKVRVVEDRFFGYDPAEAPKLPIFAQDTALDRGIKQYESMNGPVGITATATIGVNGTVGNSGTTSSLVSSLGLQNNDTNATITKTSMALIKAQTLSTINCVVTCNVGGRFFLVAGLENGIYACDMTMRRMAAPAEISRLKKRARDKKRDRNKSNKLSPEKLPVKLPYNPYKNGDAPIETESTGNSDDETAEGDDDDMATWEAPQWVRCLDLTKVTQLEILTEYNVLLVLTDKTLVWYHLDQVLAIVQNQNRKSRDLALTGYAISRNREVSFFATGYMTTGLSASSTSMSHSYGDNRDHGFLNRNDDKRRELLFYRKKDVKETLKRSTTIEVVEPVKEKGSQKRRSQFVASVPALTKKSMTRSRYGFTSTGGFHKHSHRMENNGTMNGLFDGASDSLGAAGSGDQIPGFAKGKTVPEDMLRASMKSKINVGATSTEFFRDYDNVSLPSDSLGITLFSSTFFIHTSRGFELLALSYKHPRIVPDPASISSALQRGGAIANTSLGVVHRSPKSSSGSPTRSPNGSNSSANVVSGASAIESLKRRLENSKPVGAFMLSDNTILLVYDQVAIFVDKLGNMSLPIVINMLTKIKYAVVSYPYLVAVSDEMVEIRRLDLNVKKAVLESNTGGAGLTAADLGLADSAEHNLNKMPLQPVNRNVSQATPKKGNKMTSRFVDRSMVDAINKNLYSNAGKTKTKQSYKQKIAGSTLSPSVSPSKASSFSANVVLSNTLCPLKQVITGKNIRLVVANTRRSTKTGQEIMIAMAHPKYPGRQLLFELVKNEFVCDDESSSLRGL